MAGYETLLKPPLSPPGWLFPVVWTILYILMGVAAAEIWKGENYGKDVALTLYAVQLAFNFMWPIFFFVYEARLLSFFWLLILVFIVFICIVYFSKISRKAAYLLLPYFAWLIFAAYLNLGSYLLNR